MTKSNKRNTIILILCCVAFVFGTWFDNKRKSNKCEEVFTENGITVYRFYDNGKYHYVANKSDSLTQPMIIVDKSSECE